MAKVYYFTVTLAGRGKDMDDAWADAIEGFCGDPGFYDEKDVVVEEE